jgi:hypothetical protein
MKRKVGKKTSGNKVASKRPVRSTSRRKSSSNSMVIQFVPVSFRKIVVWGALPALIIGLILFGNRHSVEQSVAGASVFRGLFAQAYVQVPDIPGAVSYNIYYKQSSDEGFYNAVRHVSPSVDSYLISHLKKGVDYQYRISAVDASGAEFWWSPVLPITSLESM